VSATVLDEILARTRQDLERRKRDLPIGELEGRDSAPSKGFRDALTGPDMAVIAEFKRRSPSAGQLREGADVGEIAASYERGGAAAMSVLTEGPHFEGSLEDLRQARAACALPLLRKDFIIDAYQLHEARAAGADAVLLIVAALSAPELVALRENARWLDLDVLVEVHTAEELSRVLDTGIAGLGESGAMAIGVPGCPEFACWTASIDKVRMVLMLRVSRCLLVSNVCSLATIERFSPRLRC